MRCPEGHESTATDYCDVCGLAMPAADPAAGRPGTDAMPRTEPAHAPVGADCPHCGAANVPDALFCEACGYDFTTGAVPTPLEPPPGTSPGTSTGTSAAITPVPAPGSNGSGDPRAPGGPAAAGASASPAPGLHGWVAEVWIDPDWYAAQESTDPLPSPGLPQVVRLSHTSVLVGRTSRSRGIDPDIDLSSDNGISRRHAQLTTDGSRWWVEDLGSSNGTYVGPGTGPLPLAAVPPGEKREVGPDDRVYLGAWTRLVVRRATDGEL